MSHGITYDDDDDIVVIRDEVDSSEELPTMKRSFIPTKTVFLAPVGSTERFVRDGKWIANEMFSKLIQKTTTKVGQEEEEEEEVKMSNIIEEVVVCKHPKQCGYVRFRSIKHAKLARFLTDFESFQVLKKKCSSSSSLQNDDDDDDDLRDLCTSLSVTREELIELVNKRGTYEPELTVAFVEECVCAMPREEEYEKQTIAFASERKMREVLEGVFLIENFVSEEEEEMLIGMAVMDDKKFLCPRLNPSSSVNNSGNNNNNNNNAKVEDDKNNENDDIGGNWRAMSKRRVRHYGKAFDYDTRDAANDADAEIPKEFDDIVRKRLADLIKENDHHREQDSKMFDDDESGVFKTKRLLRRTSLDGDCVELSNKEDDDYDKELSRALRKVIAYNQITVNEYPPGTGLAPHVDTHSAFTETILSLSLGDRCVMEFRHPNGYTNDSKYNNIPHRALELPRRSLLVLTGMARYNRQHYIPKRKSDPVYCEDENKNNIEEENNNNNNNNNSTTIIRRKRTSTRYSYTIRQTKSIKECFCEFAPFCDHRDGPFSRIVSRKPANEDFPSSS